MTAGAIIIIIIVALMRVNEMNKLRHGQVTLCIGWMRHDRNLVCSGGGGSLGMAHEDIRFNGGDTVIVQGLQKHSLIVHGMNPCLVGGRQCGHRVANIMRFNEIQNQEWRPQRDKALKNGPTIGQATARSVSTNFARDKGRSLRLGSS